MLASSSTEFQVIIDRCRWHGHQTGNSEPLVILTQLYRIADRHSTQMTPTGESEGWRSQMSLPRVNYLKNATRIGYVLVSEPYQIQTVFSQELAYNSSLGNSSILLDYSTIPSGALYFEANITGLSSYTISSGQLNFTFSSSISGEFITGGTTVNGDTWLDRGHTYAFENPYFTNKFSTSGLYSGADNGTWTISGVIDRTIFEVFVNGAEQSGTMTFYPNRPLDTMRIGAAGIASNATVSVGVWALEDTWEAQADLNGTVLGNVTSTGGSSNSSVKLF
jgi:beta-fructofuranosidase